MSHLITRTLLEASLALNPVPVRDLPGNSKPFPQRLAELVERANGEEVETHYSNGRPIPQSIRERMAITRRNNARLGISEED